MGKDDDEMRKSSTMNSMYIGSTISKPNVESIINAVATILHSQMLEVSLYLSNNFISLRIKIKAKKLSKKVHFSIFPRRNISWRSLRRLTNKG